MSSKMLMFALALSFSASVMAGDAVTKNATAETVSKEVAAPKTHKHHKNKKVTTETAAAATTTTQGTDAAAAAPAPEVAVKHHHKKKGTETAKVAAPSTDTAVTAGTTTDAGATTATTEVEKPAKKVKAHKTAKHHHKKNAGAAPTQQL